MRIAVLTHKPYSYSSQRLLEEAGKMGVFCEIVLFKETAIMIKSNEVILKVFKEKGVEAVFSRPKTVLSQLMLYALSLTRIIEEEKFRVINPYDGYLNTIDKVITYKNLCSKGLPIPDSIASPCRKSLLEMEPPFFLKPIYGSRGRGIRLIGDVFLMPLEDSGVWVAQAPARDENWDLRVLVLGSRVIAAVKRISEKPVTNVAQGASVKPFDASDEVEELAVKASEALKCVFAGIDLSFKNGEAFILDVNPQPDFMAVEKTGVNVARELLSYLLGGPGEG